MCPSPIKVDLAEEKLLCQIQKGNYQAYRELYDRYAAGVMMRIRKLVLDPCIAEDLHQEVFLQIWQQRETLPTDVPFLAVLIHRAKLQVYKYYHQASKDAKMRDQILRTATELYDRLEDQLSFKETNAILESVIAKLPPQRQKIFVRIKMEGRSYEETASEFGVSISTIKDHMTRALKFIRNELTHNNPSAFILFVLNTLF